MRPEGLAVLKAVAERETGSGAVGIAALIDATGLEPQLVVNEIERLLREGYISGEFRKLLSGGDPRPWFLMNPLISERGNAALEMSPRVGATPGNGAQKASKRWDAFISHASEDKADFVAELAKELTGRGLLIWYDDDVLEVGDSVRKAIDEGLNGSDFGVVVISKDFMRKDWTNRELDGLLALEQGVKRLLPVWHGVERDDVQRYSPTVAGRFAVRSKIGIVAVSDALCRAMKRGQRPPTLEQAVATPERDPDPGPVFTSQLWQLANSRVYAWVVVGAANETDRKFTDDEIETFTSWLASIEPAASTTHANSEFISMLVPSPDGGGAFWIAEVRPGPVINLVAALQPQEVPDTSEVLITFEELVGWWGKVLDGLKALVGNLQLDRVRLGFGLYPYGPNSTRVVGFNFSQAPVPVQRARHQIPPWHETTRSFDPFNPPSGLLDTAIRSVLDTFSYGRVDAVVAWANGALSDGTLKGHYRRLGSKPVGAAAEIGPLSDNWLFADLSIQVRQFLLEECQSLQARLYAERGATRIQIVFLDKAGTPYHYIDDGGIRPIEERWPQICRALDHWQHAVMTRRSRPEGFEVIVIPRWDPMRPPREQLQEIANVEVGPKVGGPPVPSSR